MRRNDDQGSTRSSNSSCHWEFVAGMGWWCYCRSVLFVNPPPPHPTTPLILLCHCLFTVLRLLSRLLHILAPLIPLQILNSFPPFSHTHKAIHNCMDLPVNHCMMFTIDNYFLSSASLAAHFLCAKMLYGPCYCYDVNLHLFVLLLPGAFCRSAKHCITVQSIPSAWIFKENHVTHVFYILEATCRFWVMDLPVLRLIYS